jgi:hypothetical protein
MSVKATKCPKIRTPGVSKKDSCGAVAGIICWKSIEKEKAIRAATANPVESLKAE